MLCGTRPRTPEYLIASSGPRAMQRPPITLSDSQVCRRTLYRTRLLPARSSAPQIDRWLHAVTQFPPQSKMPELQRQRTDRHTHEPETLTWHRQRSSDHKQRARYTNHSPRHAKPMPPLRVPGQQTMQRHVPPYHSNTGAKLATRTPPACFPPRPQYTNTNSTHQLYTTGTHSETGTVHQYAKRAATLRAAH
jgi:hypothetical protein